MNTASLRLLPPCQRGFQCWGMLEWIKWIFYHENTIHFSSAFLLHTDVGCRGELTVPEGLKGNIIWKCTKSTKSIRSSEIFPENSKQQKVMYDCFHQPKPQFKMRSKCSTGESGREAACLQCLFRLLELSCYLYFFLRTKDLLPRPAKKTQANWALSIQRGTALHLCHDFTVEHLDLIFTGTVICGDNHTSCSDVWCFQET